MDKASYENKILVRPMSIHCEYFILHNVSSFPGFHKLLLMWNIYTFRMSPEPSVNQITSYNNRLPSSQEDEETGLKIITVAGNSTLTGNVEARLKNLSDKVQHFYVEK